MIARRLLAFFAILAFIAGAWIGFIKVSILLISLVGYAVLVLCIALTVIVCWVETQRQYRLRHIWRSRR